MSIYIFCYLLFFIYLLNLTKPLLIDFLDRREVSRTFKKGDKIIKKYFKKQMSVEHVVCFSQGLREFSVNIECEIEDVKYEVRIKENYTKHQVSYIEEWNKNLLTNESANSFFFEHEIKINSLVEELKKNLKEKYRLEEKIQGYYYTIVRKYQIK